MATAMTATEQYPQGVRDAIEQAFPGVYDTGEPERAADPWDIDELERQVREAAISGVAYRGSAVAALEASMGRAARTYAVPVTRTRQMRQVRYFGEKPPTVHEIVQLRKLRVVSRREARRMLGLPTRWWLLGR